jgi:hypothetical protein
MFRMIQPLGGRFAAPAAGGGGAGVTTLISDTFTDANTTALASHTIAPTNTVAASWSASVATFTIQSNAAVVATVTSSEAIVLANSTKSDLVLTCIVSTPATKGMGVIFRYTDSTHYWLAQIDETGDAFQLYENSAGFNLRASASVAIDASVAYTIVVTTSGTSIACTLNGANPVDFSSSANQAATIVGLRGSGVGCAADDFQVVG